MILILIVDDNLLRANTLKVEIVSKLEIAEEQIHHTDNLKDAIDKLRKIKYDLIVVDIVIPIRSDGERHSKYGISLLRRLEKKRGALILPNKILAITAESEEIDKYIESLDSDIFDISHARNTDSRWISKAISILNYRLDELRSSSKINDQIILTIHGIRTIGDWQDKLRSLVVANCNQAQFYNYKYKYFPAFGIIFPSINKKQIYDLVEFINAKDIESKKDIDLVLFAHSFGSYLLTKSLEKISFSEKVKSVKVVFAGSVLSHKYDFKFKNKNIYSIYNFCGSDDYVLYLSELFCCELGMAGKIGFDGMDGGMISNHYLEYGHSDYFIEENNFLKKYWIPIVNNNPSVNLSKIKASTIDNFICSKFLRYSIYSLLSLYFLINYQF